MKFDSNIFKKIVLILLHAIFFIFLPIYSSDKYIPLEQVSIDGTDDVGNVVFKRSVIDLFNDGVRTSNQELNGAQRRLTTLVDFAQFRKNLQLKTLTKLNVSGNYLQSDDFCTVLKNVPALVFINFSNNQVSTLKHIPLHDTVQTVLLNGNQIEELNLGDVLTRLSALHKGAFHDNPLKSDTITNINGVYPQVQELWFPDDSLTVPLIQQCIKACPNLTAELMAGNRDVQMYYSVTEQQYDDCNECTVRNATWAWAYLMAPIIGCSLGLGVAAITAMAQVRSSYADLPVYSPEFAAGKKHEEDLFRIYCAIFIPVGGVVPVLCYRLGKTIRNYCTTKPEDRYVVVSTRSIAKQPQLLDLIDDAVDSDPEQER